MRDLQQAFMRLDLPRRIENFEHFLVELRSLVKKVAYGYCVDGTQRILSESSLVLFLMYDSAVRLGVSRVFC
jgi:hypothetical protein